MERRTKGSVPYSRGKSAGLPTVCLKFFIETPKANRKKRRPHPAASRFRSRRCRRLRPCAPWLRHCTPGSLAPAGAFAQVTQYMCQPPRLRAPDWSRSGGAGAGGWHQPGASGRSRTGGVRERAQSRALPGGAGVSAGVESPPAEPPRRPRERAPWRARTPSGCAHTVAGGRGRDRLHPVAADRARTRTRLPAF